jgi:replicative DNA helicase
MKDAAEFIAKGSEGVSAFRSLIEHAKRYTPDAIINSFSDIKSALQRKEAVVVTTYPFTGLQGALHGLHKGEFILLKGLEKLGKTEICRAICYQALQTTEARVATIFLEESEDETIHGISTYQLGTPTNITGSMFSDNEVLSAYQEAVKNDESRLYIHTHFATEEDEELVNNVRFLVAGAGVSLVLLDNLTMLTTGREGEDERLRIDRIIRRLRDLVNELHFCLVLVAHVNDDGKTRGSRLPDKLCNTIISIDRDKLAPTVGERNVVRFMVEGARTKGTTMGPAGEAFFDPETFKLRDLTDQDLMEPNFG